MLQSLQSEGSILGFRHFLLLLSTSGQGLPIDLLCQVKKKLGQAKPFEDAKVWWKKRDRCGVTHPQPYNVNQKKGHAEKKGLWSLDLIRTEVGT